MSQTFLTENPPMILDSTCSDKKIWPRFASLRMDIKREVNPDIIADASWLPFRNRIFDAIYCDPPHMIKPDGEKGFWGKRGDDMKRFGWWKTKSHWFKFLYLTNTEFLRCLKSSGFLY